MNILELSEQEIARRKSLDEIRALGIDPYPAAEYPTNAFSDEIIANFRDEDEPREVCIAGRMMSRRVMGKATFLELLDSRGRIQVYITRDDICPEEDKTLYNSLVKKLLDLGDFIGVKGYVFRTKTGEISVHVRELTLLAKSLKPLPSPKEKDGEVFDAFEDPELRYRRRYVDLIVNPNVKETFYKRAKVITTMRSILDEAGYTEVETPTLQNIPGGASARPFITHFNALSQEMYCRIATELYLKRLIVGGFEGVYEIGKNFRNEGMSVRHNPEFTMIEFYEAFSDYERMMQMAEDVIRNASRAVNGTAKISYNGKEVDLESPFERLTILEAIKKYNPHYTDEQLNDAEWLKKEIVKHGESLPPSPGIGSLQLALFEGCAEGKLWNPTFIVDYPVEVSPLARASDTKQGLTERFELFVVGRELANGYSELNDPEDQAERFKSQVAQKDAGDDEAMHYDADYIRAMEYGLPPPGGSGIGLDRLVMLLTDSQTIRDVILFPQMRPE